MTVKKRIERKEYWEILVHSNQTRNIFIEMSTKVCWLIYVKRMKPLEARALQQLATACNSMKKNLVESHSGNFFLNRGMISTVIFNSETQLSKYEYDHDNKHWRDSSWGAHQKLVYTFLSDLWNFRQRIHFYRCRYNYSPGYPLT